MPTPPALPAPGEPRTLPPPATSAEQLREAIDWALAENVREGSALFGRINPEWIAVSGWSCGGLQALQIAAADSRVRTSIIHNSGIWPAANTESRRLPPQMDIGKATLGKLHGSVLYVLGGPTDIAYENGMDDFQRIADRPVMVANAEVGHGGTFLQANGGTAAALAVKWLDWQLRQDVAAASYFSGPDCELCKDSVWKVERKNL